MAESRDDFRDLIVEDDAGNDGKDNKKPAKTPKAPKEKKTPKPKEEKEAKPEKPEKPGKAVKKKKGAKIVLILVLLLIIAIGAFVFIEFIDPSLSLFGARDFLVESVTKLDPNYVTYETRLSELERRSEELDAREALIDTRERQHTRRQSELDDFSKELNDKELRITPIYRRIMTEQELVDMQSLSRTYSLMSPETAAEILSRLYESRDIAAILYYMGERNAAAILAEMETARAAEITMILLYD